MCFFLGKCGLRLWVRPTGVTLGTPRVDPGSGGRETSNLGLGHRPTLGGSKLGSIFSGVGTGVWEARAQEPSCGWEIFILERFLCIPREASSRAILRPVWEHKFSFCDFTMKYKEIIFENVLGCGQGTQPQNESAKIHCGCTCFQ